MKYITVFVVATLVNTLFAEFGIASFNLGPGVSGLYIAVAVMIVFGLWFGMYGALAAYCGGLLSVILLFRVPFHGPSGMWRDSF
jgi:hypothetical protein